MSTTVRSENHFRLGLLFAVGSAFTFGMSGPFAKSLMEAGWSPTAAVTARLAGGALVMAIFATIVKPDWIREARRHARVVIAYGLVPIAGAQLCYYNAVSHLSVGVALLLEYTAPILVVGWIWATTRRRPRGMTLAGVGLAVAGIMLVLDIVSGRCPRQRHRSGVGAGRRDLRGLLLHDVRRGHRRRQRTERDHAVGRRSGGRCRRGWAAGPVRGDAADLHRQQRGGRRSECALVGAGDHARGGFHRDRLHAGHQRRGAGCGRASPHWSALARCCSRCCPPGCCSARP